MYKVPCKKTMGMGDSCSEGWLCGACVEVTRLNAIITGQVHPVAVPDGWKLVPIEPTQGMNSAGYMRNLELGGGKRSADETYKAMVRASPSAPAAHGDAKELTKEDMHEAYYAYSGNSEIDYDGREWSNFMGGWNAAIAAKAAS